MADEITQTDVDKTDVVQNSPLPPPPPAGEEAIQPADEAGQAASVREAFEQRAQVKRAQIISEQQKFQGIGMEEPGFKPSGPKADEAERELAIERGRAHWPQWAPLPNVYERIAEARSWGHSREDIDKYITDLRDRAVKAGASNDQINQYLMGVAPREYHGAEKPNPTMGQTADFVRDWQDTLFGPHNLSGSMGLPMPGSFTGGAAWKQLGWSIWDAAKTFPGGVVGGVAAMAELADGTEKSDGEIAKLLWEASQAVGAFAPFLGKFGKSIRMPRGGAPLEGEIIPPTRPAGGPLAPRTGPVIEGEFTRADSTPGEMFPKFADFLDGATAIAGKHPEGLTGDRLALALRDLGDHFVASGDHPLTVAQSHPTYDSFVARMEGLRSNGFINDANMSAARTPSMLRLTGPDPDPGVDSFAKNVVAQVSSDTPLTRDGILDNVAKNFQQLMADESGAIKWPFWRTDIRPDEMFRPDPLRYGEVVDTVRAIFSPAGMSPRLSGQARSIMSWSALETERVIHGLNQYGRYTAELSTDNRYNMIAAYQRGLLPVIERNRTAFERQYPVGDPMRFMADNYLQPGSPLFGFFKEMKFHSDQAWKEMDALGIAPGYVEWYFPGQWRETQQARSFLGKGRLGGGSKKFTTEKRYPDILEGIAAGLTPVSDNPVQVMASRLATEQKFIRDFKVFRAFEADGAILPEDQVTQGMRDDGWVKAPEYFSLPGQNVGAKFVHPDAARLLKSMTDSGFAKYSLYRILRQAANFVTSVNLAGPGFHSTFVTLDAMSTDLALGVQELSRALFNPTQGKWAEAGHAAVSMLRSPLAPILNVRAGMAMKALAENPQRPGQTVMGLPKNLVSNALANYMNGGGRMGLEDIYQSSRSGSFWKGLKAQFDKDDGHMTFTQEIAEMARDTMGDVRVAGAFKLPAWVGLMTARMVARMGDTISAPLMGYYVPMLKAGSHYRHMESAMRVMPNAGPLEVQRVSGSISSMLDNRFGEMVYDNKFWNAYAKTAGQLAFRAMGFNYGALDTIGVGSKEIVSALIGRPDRLREPLPTLNAQGMPAVEEIKQLGSKGSALIGMLMFTALAGALIGTLEGTFKEDEWKPYDYLYPKLANGQRIKLPSHMNNAYEFYNHPGQSFRNRINGLWVMGYDQLRNMQWDDRTPIVPPSAGGGLSTSPEALEDRFDYMQHAMWPYSLQQLLNPTQAQQEIDPALRMLGVGPAPWEIRNPEGARKFESRRTKEQQKAWDYQQKKKKLQESK